MISNCVAGGNPNYLRIWFVLDFLYVPFFATRRPCIYNMNRTNARHINCFFLNVNLDQTKDTFQYCKYCNMYPECRVFSVNLHWKFYNSSRHLEERRTSLAIFLAFVLPRSYGSPRWTELSAISRGVSDC